MNNDNTLTLNPVKYDGKLIGRGSFGAVFWPPLPCLLLLSKKYARYNSEKYVGKCFMSLKLAKDEYAANNLVKDMDPKGLFTLQAKGICSLATLSKIMRPFHIRFAGYKAQIIYPFGGEHFYRMLLVSLHSFCKENFREFVNVVFFFLKNLAKMNASGIYHLDIKDMNTLYNSEKGLLYLIDFGFISDKVDRAYSHNLRPSLGGSYNQPPEIRAINFLLYHKPLSKQPTARHRKKFYKKANPHPLPEIFSSMAIDRGDTNKSEAQDYGQAMLDMFMVFSDWYKFDEDDQLFINIRGPFYDELEEKVKDIARKKSRSRAALLDMLNEPEIASKMDSWGLGIMLFEWLTAVYDCIEKDTNESKLLADLLRVVCNHLLQSDISQRLSVQDAYNEMISILAQKYPDYYRGFSKFAKHVEKTGKNPGRHNINNRLDALNVPFANINQMSQKRKSAKKKR